MSRHAAIRLGLIGAGNVVETYHLPVLRRLPGVEIAWVCDRDLARARSLASLFRLPRAAEKLEDCPDVDVVLVGVPVGARREVMEQVLARGWHALCEKPFALTLADHRWMVEEARRRRVRLGVGLVRRFCSPTIVARQVLQDGAFGPLTQVLAGEGSALHRTGRAGGFYQADARASGGVLFETGCHLVDQVFAMCGATGFQLSHCCQQRWEGLELETSARGTLDLPACRVPFALVVSRLHDLYNGIVLRFPAAELRVGLAPDAAVEMWTLARTRSAALAPGPHATTVHAAIRAQWESFLAGCRRSPEFTDEDTGLLTTQFLEACGEMASRTRPAAEAAR